ELYWRVRSTPARGVLHRGRPRTLRAGGRRRLRRGSTERPNAGVTAGLILPAAVYAGALNAFVHTRRVGEAIGESPLRCDPWGHGRGLGSTPSETPAHAPWWSRRGTRHPRCG